MAMAANDHELFNRLAVARARFGRFLHTWRTVNNWSSHTTGEWASLRPDLLPFKITSPTWVSFENDQKTSPYPETFIALELLNRAVADEDYAGVTKRVLLDRLLGSRPVRHEDGSLWTAADFFECFLGGLESPAEFAAPRFNAAAAGAEWRRAFAAAAADRAVPGGATGALVALSLAARLNPEQVGAASAVASGGAMPDELTSEALGAALRIWSATV